MACRPADSLPKAFIGWAAQSRRIRNTSFRRNLLMGLLSPHPPCVVPTSHSGFQEIHVDGAGLAGLAFAIRLAENLPVTGRTLVHVWDGRLQRTGVQRKRRLAFRSPGKDVDSGQAITLHGSVLNAAVSSHTQAAIFPEGKQQLWEDTGNTSISKVEEALFRRAQSPDLAQHIIFNDHDLSEETLQDIARKPHVIIIGAEGGHSTICSSFAAAQTTQDEQEVTCRIELAYHMDEGLKRALKESAATSVVHTIGQRVFLHNFDCKGGVGSVTIRATPAELEELAHYRQQTSSATLGAVGKELKSKQSLSAVSLSDLIDTALQVYGIPAKAVRRITGTRNTLSRAPFFAQELHPNSTNGGHVMLIGDAAMRVEFWPGKGVNAAFATAHVAAASLLSSMTKDASQPCFALSPSHIQAFSLHMTNVADQFGASHSMDILPAPAASSRWSVIANMAPEDVLNELMGQTCERGATAVDHLLPAMPRLMLVEARLRRMMPSKVHVLRRMLRDGPWPGESAKVMAPLSLPPLPSCHIQVPDTALAAPSSTAVTARAQRLNEPPHVTSLRHYDTSLAKTFRRHAGTSSAQPLSRQGHISPPTPLARHEHAVLRPHSTPHSAVPVTHSPTISSTAPARESPAQQSDVEAILAGRTLQHVSVDASSDQSSSAHPPTPDSARSSSSVDSATVSEVEARIAVLRKWGQLVPPSLHLPQASSHHASKSMPCLNMQDMCQPELLSISMSHAESAAPRQLATGTRTRVHTHAQLGPGTVSAATAAAPSALRQQAAAGTERLQRVSKGTQTPRSMPQTPLQQSSKHPQSSNLHPQRAPAPSQGQRQQLQPASAAPFGSPILPQSSRSRSSLPQSSPPLAQSSLSLPQGSPQLPLQGQGSQQSQELREAGLGPKAQFPLQMWPYVRKYAVPQPLKAGSTIDPKTAPPAPPQGVPDTQLPQPSTEVNQQQRPSLEQSSDRHSGVAEPSSRATPNWSPTPLLMSGTVSTTVLCQALTKLPMSDSQQPVDSSIQPQTPLASPSHRRMYSQDAIQQQADVAGPEGHTMAGNVGDTPEWIAHQGSSPQQGMAGNIWQTPQLPSTWSGQGNPLFGWWELGSAVIGDEDLHQAKSE